MLNILCVLSLSALPACTSGENKQFHASAPLPPLSDPSGPSVMGFDQIQPTSGDYTITLNNAQNKTKNCAFSSHHRKNAIGYEIDDRRQIGMNFSPSLNMDDANVDVGIRFTMALGGESQKRPKCTYNNGYYGFIPYAINNDIDMTGLMDVNTIKSYIQERLDAREQRRIEREKENSLYH